jgi:outer membrane protein assembly factor BamB
MGRNPDWTGAEAFGYLPRHVDGPANRGAIMKRWNLARAAIPVLATVLAGAPGATRAEDWPCLLGPDRNGVSTETGLTAGWPQGKTPTVLFRLEVGKGYAAVAVAGSLACTTGYREGQDTVYAFSAEHGKMLWQRSYPTTDGKKYEGTFATPTLDGERVFVVSKDGRVVCLKKLTGEIAWEQSLVKDHAVKIPNWGLASSPVVLGNVLVLQAETASASVLALDKMTGKRLWAGGSPGKAFSTPVPYNAGGRDRLLVLTGKALLTLDAQTGEQVSEFAYASQYENAIVSPVLADGRAFVSSAYAPFGVAVDVGDPANVKKAWDTRDLKIHFATPILWRGHLYGFDGDVRQKAVFRCVELATGRTCWTADGVKFGHSIAADGKLIHLTEDGDLALVEPSPKAHKELARAHILEKPCWVGPALANGRLYGRNAAGSVVCVDLRAK